MQLAGILTRFLGREISHRGYGEGREILFILFTTIMGEKIKESCINCHKGSGGRAT